MNLFLALDHVPLKEHPFAGIFELLFDSNLDQLAADIEAHGQREPIMLHKAGEVWLILDGRNRYRACVKKNIAVQYEEFQGDDGEALDYVISKNVHRRHLDKSQRAYAMACYEKLNHGGYRRPKALSQDANLHLDIATAPPPEKTRAELAEQGKVSERSIASGAVVRDYGAPELQDAVRQGVIAVSTAAEIAERPVEQQKAILDALPRTAEGKLTPDAKREVRKVAKEVRAEDQTEKKRKRDEKEKKLGTTIAARGKFGVVLEDFEWDHQPYSRDTGMDRHPSNHYPTAHDAHTAEEIVARTAERFACADDKCVLYMWTTIPHCAIAMDVIRLRGFEYKSQRCWDKVRSGDGRGPGYWVTGEHELLLIATRGGVVAPFPAHFPSRFEAPVGAHSEKPDQQYEHAEYHFPNTPKIELNARRAREGWIRWGNEAPETEQQSLGIDAASPGDAGSEEAA